jgi:L-rhamnonate dehydratase
MMYAASRTHLFATALAPLPDYADRPLKIEAVELVELHGRYTDTAGINKQQQVTPLDIYDDLRPVPYTDKPSGSKEVLATAVYLRIRTAGGPDGLYGPIEKDAAIIVNEDLSPFLLGKDALAGERLWDQMYRSNRHSRDGLFMMAISAVDNTLWDVRGKYYNVPVYRLLGGPTRSSVEMYASCLGFSLEPAAVRTRALAIKKEGYRYQKWFMGYGPGSGPEGMRKNVELVRTLRETLGEDDDIMLDCWQSMDPNYVIDLAARIAEYRPAWLEECCMPDRIDSYRRIKDKISIPLSGAEHEYTRWGFKRFIDAGALDILQPDIYWCGGLSETLKIAAYATVHDLITIPHGHSTPAGIHVSVTQSPIHTPYQEYLVKWNDIHQHFLAHPVRPQRGEIHVPTTPGLGMDLDPAKIEHEEEAFAP